MLALVQEMSAPQVMKLEHNNLIYFPKHNDQSSRKDGLGYYTCH